MESAVNSICKTLMANVLTLRGAFLRQQMLLTNWMITLEIFQMLPFVFLKMTKQNAAVILAVVFRDLSK